MQNKLFHDDIDVPMRVTTVSGWLWLSGAVLLLTALAVWLFFGEAAHYVSTCAVYREGKWVCFVDTEYGPKVKGIQNAEIIEIASAPVSCQAASDKLGIQYYIDRAGLKLWNTQITLNIPGTARDGDARDIKINFGTLRPIDLLLKRQ